MLCSAVKILRILDSFTAKKLLCQQLSLSGYARMKTWYRKIYLNSEHWKSFRRACLIWHGRRCKHCRAAGILHVHHIVYKSIYDVEFSDVIVLCPSCHRKEHNRLRVIRRKTRKVKNNVSIQCKTAVKNGTHGEGKKTLAHRHSQKKKK